MQVRMIRRILEYEQVYKITLKFWPPLIAPLLLLFRQLVQGIPSGSSKLSSTMQSEAPEIAIALLDLILIMARQKSLR